MASDTKTAPKKGEIVKIPAVSSIAGKVEMHSEGTSKFLWANLGSLIVFGMAAALLVLPLVIIFLLMRVNHHGLDLTWLWLTMLVITEAFAFLTAYGLVRSVLEADSQ